ncbi:HNH endonuclease signature motif containing protein [Leifsonia sp. A12D58]|uniref:HNH endonuclease signature motif containing protein n=1 Tax=Leifsonia sp. A12D58 TaxID=3397674 RepID=UPI0039DF6F7A
MSSRRWMQGCAGHIDGQVAPISILSVEQMICAGGVQPVTITAKGKVIELGVTDRCFTGQQRRAVTLRDGGCIIPGCQSPAAWAEIHHVIPYALGGPTEVSNGVTLCWFHHRTVHRSGWQIRMVDGVPQVKAPVWLDGFQRWHVATKSPTRMTYQLADQQMQRDQRDQRDELRHRRTG